MKIVIITFFKVSKVQHLTPKKIFTSYFIDFLEFTVSSDWNNSVRHSSRDILIVFDLFEIGNVNLLKIISGVYLLR